MAEACGHGNAAEDCRDCEHEADLARLERDQEIGRELRSQDR